MIDIDTMTKYQIRIEIARAQGWHISGCDDDDTFFGLAGIPPVTDTAVLNLIDKQDFTNITIEKSGEVWRCNLAGVWNGTDESRTMACAKAILRYLMDKEKK
jgi:hypothetical protein